MQAKGALLAIILIYNSPVKSQVFEWHQSKNVWFDFTIGIEKRKGVGTGEKPVRKFREVCCRGKLEQTTVAIVDSCSGFEERAFRHSSENHRKIYRHFWYNIGNRKVGGLNEKNRILPQTRKCLLAKKWLYLMWVLCGKLYWRKTGKQLEDCDWTD